jgi:hypothetical protein
MRILTDTGVQFLNEGVQFTISALNDGWAVGWKSGMHTHCKWERHLRRIVEFVEFNYYLDLFNCSHFCKMRKKHKVGCKQYQAFRNFTIIYESCISACTVNFQSNYICFFHKKFGCLPCSNF